MDRSRLLADITKELRTYAESEYQAAQQWFFKEEVRLLGVRVGRVRAVARKYYRPLKYESKQVVFDTAEELMKIDQQEMRIIGTEWVRRRQAEFVPTDFIRFERWVKLYVSNWAICDGVCSWLTGDLLCRYPELIAKTERWRRSKNRWMRRAAAVSLIPPVKAKQNLRDVFACADDLLEDEDDMVQKGYGWMLKEASNVYPKEVFEYVMKRKKQMPRTALRYAIEKLSATRRKQAMAK